MKKLCALFIVISLLAVVFPVFAYEDIPVNLLINGKTVSFPFSPVIRDGVTYVDLRTLTSSLGLSYKTYPDHDSVIVSNSRTSICLVPGEEYATVADLTGKSDKEYTYHFLSAPCIYFGNHLAVGARDIASVFGYALSFNKETQTVYFGYAPEMISAATREAIGNRAYYFQNQAEFALPSFGSGYCWACSYAMLISNVTGLRITPSDIAEVNLTKSSSGAYCYHNEIASAFNVKFTNALSGTSPYYGGRDSVSGGTYIKNPDKNDSTTRAALKEALALHPAGIIVRYADFPHSMVAVACEGDIILFNDPAPSSSGTYSDVGKYQGVPFSETCVAKKGFVLSDVTFIQAISY